MGWQWKKVKDNVTGDYVHIQEFTENGVTLEDVRAHRLPHHLDDDCDVKLPTIDRCIRYDYGKEERSLPVKAVLQKRDPEDNQDFYYIHSKENVEVTAVLDTGAESLCVKKGLPKALNWIKVGTTVVSGANSKADVDIWRGAMYFGNIEMESKVVRVSGFFLESDLPGNLSMLIGRPVLAKANLVISKGFVGFKFFSDECKLVCYEKNET